ncbi:MAG: outer membrane beta-barrel protein [Marinifilaceae bacterium]
MNTHTLSFILIALLLPLGLSAQSNGGTRISAGLALGKYGKFDNHIPFSNETNRPSFIIQAERDWVDNFSIGAYIGYSGQKHDYINKYSGDIKHNYYRVGALLSYNLNPWLSQLDLNPGRNWDIYTSLKTGFSLEHRKIDKFNYNLNDELVSIQSDSDSNLLFDLGVSLGARYYLSYDFALFSELGWGNAGFLTLGASFTL